MEYEYETYGDLRVAWTAALDGGGRGFGQLTVPAVRNLIGPVDRAFEFCAGPGFVGFSLLAHGLCRSLCLADVNPAAVEAIRHTIAINGLEDRVSVYLSNGLDAIPRSEQWDLVVSNPPHFDGAQTGEWGLRALDPGWSIHRRFFAHVRPYLRPHGHCLFLENYHGSSEALFTPMLENTGLEYAGSFMVNEHIPYPMVDLQLPPVNTFFFFWARVKHDTFVWHEASPDHDVEFALDDSGAIVRGGDGGGGPLRLRVGEKYAITVRSDREGWALDWDFLANRLHTHRVRKPRDGAPYGHGQLQRVEFISTAPNQIVDDAGRVLVEFE